MARIACFIDDTDIVHTVQHQLCNSGHEWRFFSASRLTHHVRAQVQAFAPDLVFLELTPAIDNAHLFFFVRAARDTRELPVIFVSKHVQVAQQMHMLDADGCLRYPFSVDQFWNVLVDFAPLERAAAA